MSIYSALRYRISNRANMQSILHDMVTRIEYLEQLINKEEVLDPHSEKTVQRDNPMAHKLARKQPIGRLTHYRRAREGDRSSIEWLIARHNDMTMTRDLDLVKAITHIENLLPFAQASKMASYIDKKSGGLRERNAICDSAQDFLNAEDDEVEL